MGKNTTYMNKAYGGVALLSAAISAVAWLAIAP